jgi:hypothetical protein
MRQQPALQRNGHIDTCEPAEFSLVCNLAQTAGARSETPLAGV